MQTNILATLVDASTLNGWLTTERVLGILRASIVLVGAAGVAWGLRRAVVRLIGTHWSRQQVVVSRRVITYFVWGVAGTTALREVGFELSILLGAAGAVTFALGYASQKSISQLITGLFIIAEQPFVIGDTITVAGVTGEVLSIDLLSIKLRTGDNLFVRVPNEILLNGPVINNSHYTIRRLDIDLGVSYREDISRVSRVLFEVADKNPLCLEEPRPLFIFGGYGESSLKMQFCVWGRSAVFLDLKNSMYESIKKAFDAHGIEMPYPHRALVPGAGRDTLSLDLTRSAGPSEGPAQPRAQAAEKAVQG
jgi:small-conductance mechanosensitive channel